ncbi:MAG TPA: hypothetical protein VNX68_00390, partial [Nitrosopumilaceae archaeon]|nr:hypothetical protein [Nitrosopumilaceae archaeon]
AFQFKPVVFNFNLGSTTSNFVKNREYKGNAFVIGTEKNPEKTSLDIVYKSKERYNKAPEVTVKNYSPEGKEQGKLKVKGDGKNEIVSTRIHNLSVNEQLLLGTFKKSPPPRKYFNPASNKALSFGDDAEGMFFSKIENGTEKYIKYYAFKEFNQFYSLVTGQATVSDKQKEKLSQRYSGLTYRLLVHDIIEKNDQYIMVAEAYYPQYHTQCYYNGRGQTCYQVFDGFRFTNALVAGFDKEGNKLWDNSFEIMDVLTFKLKEKVRVLPFDNETVLVYAFGSQIRSKIINGNEVVEGKTSTPLGTGFQNDQIRSSAENSIDYWYDNCFISYGYQKIKSDDEALKQGKDSKRRVYYFNKVTFQ